VIIAERRRRSLALVSPSILSGCFQDALVVRSSEGSTAERKAEACTWVHTFGSRLLVLIHTDDDTYRRLHDSFKEWGQTRKGKGQTRVF
jgi:hypothetical protein